jgi:hypothetical protein
MLKHQYMKVSSCLMIQLGWAHKTCNTYPTTVSRFWSGCRVLPGAVPKLRRCRRLGLAGFLDMRWRRAL